MFPQIHVGGSLNYFVHEWERILTQDQWFLSVLKEGLKLDFMTEPPFAEVRQSNVNLHNAALSQSEVEKVLQNDAIEPMPPGEMEADYIQHFCSPKENSRLETNYKSKTSEQVSRKTIFQDGLSKQSHKPGTTRRLGYLSGFS